MALPSPQVIYCMEFNYSYVQTSIGPE